MSLVAQVGAERNTTTDEVEVTLNSGTVSINSVSPMSGSYDYRANPSSGTGFWRLHVFSGNQSTIGYLRMRIKVHTRPGTTIQILRFSDNANAHRCSIRLGSDGTLRLHNAANTQVGSASAALTIDQEYVIELKLDGGGTTNALDARIDGSSFASGNNSTTGTWARILWGPITPNSTCDIYMDDIILNDSSGTTENSWPDSAARLVSVRPNGDGDNHAWADTGGSAGTSNNYTLVDENTPNDATDYVQSTTLNDTDMYAMGSPGLGSSDTIKAITGHVRRTNDVADAAITFKLQIIKTSGGTVAQGSAITPNETTWRTDTGSVQTPTLIAYKDPDGSAWTPQGTCESFQLGVKITTDGTNKILVSTVWAYIQYVPGSGTAYVKDLSDTVSLADAVAKTAAKGLTDSVSMAEIFGKYPKKTNSDTIIIADVLVKSVAHQLSDTVALADTLSKVLGLSKAESLSLADSLAKTAAKYQTESVAIADSNRKVVGATRSDTFTLSDALSKVGVKTVSDAVLVSDALRKTFAGNKSDTMQMSDNTTKVAGKSIADNVSMADSLARVNVKNISDSFSVTDSIRKAVSKAVSDAMSFTDSIVKTIAQVSGRIYHATFDRFQKRTDEFSATPDRVKRKRGMFSPKNYKLKKKLF